MRRFIEITISSFKIAMQELRKNKLRTFLSLFGVTIGIFCIIGVLATVNSLEQNIQREIKSLGTNTIYIDKWDYSGGPDYPWWKYVKRPEPKYDEVQQIKDRTSTAEHVAFLLQSFSPVDYGDNSIENSIVYGITEEFPDIQPLEIQYGRPLSLYDYTYGTNSIVMGNEISEKLFGEAERGVGKQVSIKGKKNTIVGIIKKQGNQMIGGWNFDKSVVLDYKYARTMIDEKRSNPILIVKGKEGINSKILKDELKGAMRSVRKLKPIQEDNFSLNDVNDFSEALSKAFVSVNIGGWAIGALSFIVGIFGVANIMFVTVKERTSQIGLKKAIGAKKHIILTEFLLESAFLCIIGGFIGLLLVFILTKIITALLHFPIFLSPEIMIMAVLICIGAGVLAGIIPARRAANMDPVVAIRS
ncbi:MAG: ABC transporter permease [Flavisolibacter sp.]